MIGPAGFMAAPPSQDEVNEIMAGMERVWAQEYAELGRRTPRCHFTPMQFHMGEEESWWECAHCGHSKSIEEADQLAAPKLGEQEGGKND